MKKVAIQGQQASFHDQAAHKFFGNEIGLIYCDLPFSLTFDALIKGEADYAVVAIENSLYGSINDVYDLILRHKASIIGEVYLRIEHCLIGLLGATIEGIAEVHSHPVALAQCEDFIDTTLAHVERFEHPDTAGSVADIKTWNDPAKAAIASREAARLHGMAIIAENIETHHENYTRFVVLQKDAIFPKNANKTSLIMRTNHTPGALHKALGAFAENDINLSKLQSRPIIGKAWHYIFYVDVDAGMHTPPLQKALAALQTQGCNVTILGSYAAAKHN